MSPFLTFHGILENHLPDGTILGTLISGDTVKRPKGTGLGRKTSGRDSCVFFSRVRRPVVLWSNTHWFYLSKKSRGGLNPVNFSTSVVTAGVHTLSHLNSTTLSYLTQPFLSSISSFCLDQPFLRSFHVFPYCNNIKVLV